MEVFDCAMTEARPAADTRSAPRAGARGGARLPARRRKPLWRRVLLLAAMILATLNIWTGSPLLALWVGSQVQGDSATSLQMSTVAAVVVALAVMVVLLARAIAWLDVRYGEAVGRPPKARQVRPWMRSLAGKYGDPKQETEPLTPLERILVAMVVIVIVLFEVWFFFFAGSSLPNQ